MKIFKELEKNHMPFYLDVFHLLVSDVLNLVGFIVCSVKEK